MLKYLVCFFEAFLNIAFTVSFVNEDIGWLFYRRGQANIAAYLFVKYRRAVFHSLQRIEDWRKLFILNFYKRGSLFSNLFRIRNDCGNFFTDKAYFSIGKHRHVAEGWAY